jgi:ABC-2 type transport system permease protein
MKILAIIKKALIMQFRDYWAFLLTVLSAPFFILVYYVMTNGGSTTYSVHYCYSDTTGTSTVKQEFVSKLNGIAYANGKPALMLTETTDTAGAKILIKNRKTDILVVIPHGFSDSLQTGKAPNFQIYGEAGNPKYSVGLIFTITGIEKLVGNFTQNRPLYTFSENFMGNSQAKSEFDVYAPGIFIFSIIMLILSASLTFIRDVEDKTMIRLKLSRMTVFDYLAGNTIVQWGVGVLSFALTLWLAIMLGFHVQGSMFLVFLICSITVLSIISLCLILVAFCRNATMVMIVGNFPLFILMFFTGSMIPMPRNEIIAGFAINDLLSPTHAVIALNKIFTYGASLKDIRYETGMLLLLTCIYFSIGVSLFKKYHLANA